MSLRCACVTDETAGLSRFPNYWAFDEINASVTTFNFCFYGIVIDCSRHVKYMLCALVYALYDVLFISRQVQTLP
jgi:hypothetical protein